MAHTCKTSRRDVLNSFLTPITDTSAMFSDGTYRNPRAFADDASSVLVSIVIVVPLGIVEVWPTVLRIVWTKIVTRGIIADDHLLAVRIFESVSDRKSTRLNSSH